MAPEPDEQPDIVFGIEVYSAAHTSAVAPDRAPWLVPSSGMADRVGERLALIGDAAVSAAIGGLSDAIARVAHGVIVKFDDAATDADTRPAAKLKSVELTFGVKLTAGAGKLVEALITAGTETTLQVKVVVEPPEKA